MATTIEKGRDSGKSATPTTSANDTPLPLRPVKGELRLDSRVLAHYLGNAHQHVRELLTRHAEDFRELGVLRFQTGKPPAGPLGGRPERYALLNEDQTYLLLTYSRNTVTVRALKVRLVKAFREARQAQELANVEYLPTYRALHDEIHSLAKHSANEKFMHMNVNKLVNKAAGVGSGQRPRLDVPHRSILIAAQFVASSAMRGASDHREGYAQAKDALERFGTTLLGGDHE